MPHFVIDCSEQVLGFHSEENIMQQIHAVANSSKLFNENDIKVRVNPYAKYSVANRRDLYIHVFASIMQGRTVEQKAQLSKSIVKQLVAMFPDVPNIAMNVSEFEKATYCNRNML